ncbi:MAG: glycosyl hydrolase-related protein, partial [bacterium]
LLMASDNKGGFFRDERYLQKGRHTWTFSLFSNSGDWKRGMSYRRGAEPINPMFAVAGDGEERGGNPGAMSFCKVSPGNVILTCLKGSEGGDGSIFARFYEVEGKETDVELEFPKKIAKALIADLLEREGRALKFRGNRVLCKLAPYEIGNVKVFF